MSLPGIKFLDQYQYNNVDLWIKTGLDPVDFICDPIHKGLPMGRIIVLEGEESSCKSTLLAHIFKSCHDEGIPTFLCDGENTFDKFFAGRIGMDCSKLGMLVNKKGKAIKSIEELQKAVKSLIESVCSEDKDAPLVLGIDSIESLETESYLKASKRQIGDRARAWNPFWRYMAGLQKQYRHFTIIALNQLRSNIDTGFASGPKNVSPGGRSIGFYSSVKIRLTNRKKMTDETRGYEIYASIIGVEIIKNKVSKPFRKCLLYNRFKTGLDNAKSCLFFLASNGVLNVSTGTLRKTPYNATHFSLKDFKYKGKEVKLKKIKLNQAQQLLNKYGWDNLTEPILRYWESLE